MERVVLTVAQIKSLASFVGLTVSVPKALNVEAQYIICHGEVPAFESDEGEKIPAYSGLIAYTDDVSDSGVLELDI